MKLDKENLIFIFAWFFLCGILGSIFCSFLPGCTEAHSQWPGQPRPSQYPIQFPTPTKVPDKKSVTKTAITCDKSGMCCGSTIAVFCFPKNDPEKLFEIMNGQLVEIDPD